MFIYGFEIIVVFIFIIPKLNTIKLKFIILKYSTLIKIK